MLLCKWGIFMLDKKESLRLDLIRFPLIVAVVFIHAYESNVVFSGLQISANQTGIVTNFIKNIISNGVARVAVPLFFLMSGYFFFVGLSSKEKYFIKLKKRIKTLLIPFVFWNSFTLLVIALAQILPATQVFFSGKNPFVINFSLFDYLNAIIGINRLPISYQFWFIRDLMILVLFVPFIIIALRFVPILFLLIVFICWFFDYWIFFSPASEATLFFCFGAYLAFSNKSLFVADRYGYILVLWYFIIVILDVYFIGETFSPILHRFGIVFGVYSVLFISKFLTKIERIRTSLLTLSNASFFVYATHEPLLTIQRKFLYKLLYPESVYLTLFLYFSIPISTIIFSVFLYRILLKIFPKFIEVTTGAR